MKNLYTLLPLGIFLFGCSDSGLKKIKELSQKAEKAEIYFYEKVPQHKSHDTLCYSLQKEAVNQLLAKISKKPAPDYACNSDGKIKLKTNDGDAVSVHFTLNPSCSHVNFRLNGYAYSKVLEQEGLQKLQAFKGKTSSH